MKLWIVIFALGVIAGVTGCRPGHQLPRRLETATFGAGCFWGVEDLFLDLPGVVSTRVGFAGGHTEHATYKAVCAGGTGHAEAVEITFDPDTLVYKDLLRRLWEQYPPPTTDSQPADSGKQYRAVVFWHTVEQRDTATAILAALDQQTESTLSVQIAPATTFWPAEEYHQQYLAKRRGEHGER